MTFNGGQNNVAYTLPEDFLLGPGPNVQVQKIDFAKTLLSEYQGLYAVILDNVLSKKECDTLVRAAEAHTNGKWEQAMINIGAGHQRLITEARDCSRIIWDDHAIAAKIWARVEKFVPEISQLKNAPKITGTGPARRGETWQMSRLNERLRFLRYGAGQYFRRMSFSFYSCLRPLQGRMLESCVVVLIGSSAHGRYIRDARRGGTVLRYTASLPQRI